MGPEQAFLHRMLHPGQLMTSAHVETGPVSLPTRARQSSPPGLKNSQDVRPQGPSGDPLSPMSLLFFKYFLPSGHFLLTNLLVVLI